MAYKAHLLISSGIPCGMGVVDVGPDSCIGPLDIRTVPLFQGDPQCFRRRTRIPTLVHILALGSPLAFVPSSVGDRNPFFEDEHENSLSVGGNRGKKISAEDDRESRFSVQDNCADNHFGGYCACEQNPFSSFLRSEARDYNFAVAGFCNSEVLRCAHIFDLCGNEDSRSVASGWARSVASGWEHGDQIVGGFDSDNEHCFGSGTFADFFLAFASSALLDELFDVAYTRDVFVVEFFLVSAFGLRIWRHFL